MRKQTKQIHKKEALEALRKGSEAVFTPVADSMGAAGKNSVFYEGFKPSITNDGVTIARQIFPEDPFEAMGAALVLDAAEKTNDEAGDGTSTSIVLAHAILEKGIEELNKGYNPMLLRKELEAAKDIIVKKIKEIATEIKTKEELFDVVKISVEDDKIAKIISDARWKIGATGVIIADEGVGYEIESEEVNGYFFDSGYKSPYMITNPDRQEAVLTDCAVVVTDKYLNLNKELVPLMNSLLENKVKSLLIVADNVEGELLASLVVNKMQGVITTVAVRRPESLEELEDIATLCMCTAVTEGKGIKDITISHVGAAQKVIVSKNKTIIVGKDSPALKDRISSLKSEIKQVDKENQYLGMRLKERLAKLSGGIVILRVGAKTETERKYLKRKVDDAVAASKAALEEGIVEGAGACLYKMCDDDTLDTVGSNILRYALIAPYNQILLNAGINPDGKFYDVMTGKEVKDLRKAGIIDPAKVERCSIENAVSVAGTILTLSTAIVQIEKKGDRDMDSMV